MNKCKICGHEWESRTQLMGDKPRPLPLSCPKCKRYDWEREKNEMRHNSKKKHYKN
jgi:hypothetical protein